MECPRPPQKNVQISVPRAVALPLAQLQKATMTDCRTAHTQMHTLSILSHNVLGGQTGPLSASTNPHTTPVTMQHVNRNTCVCLTKTNKCEGGKKKQVPCFAGRTYK